MNKRALVTGGSAGLGAALVAELLAEGIEVISIDRDQPAGETPGLHHLQADLSDISARRELLAALVDGDPFEVVVLNAGISAVGAFEAIDPKQLDKVLAVNLLAPMELTRLLVTKQMVAKGGSLIFVGSLSNRLGYPGAAVYAATKQGLEAFAASLRKTGAYRVLLVLPGPLDTEHARRYAPLGSKGRKRQSPSVLARRVVSRRHRPGTVYGTVAQALVGLLGIAAPSLMTSLMRRGLFTKLRAAPSITDERA
jgi:hypothetical protein